MKKTAQLIKELDFERPIDSYRKRLNAAGHMRYILEKAGHLYPRDLAEYN